MSHVTTDMGRFAIVPEWLLDEASPNALRVWITLWIKWADKDTRECFPKRKTIASEVGCSVDTIDRAVKELAGLGALVVFPQISNEGNQMSNLYVLNLYRETALQYRNPPPGCNDPGGMFAEGGPQDCGGGAAGLPSTGRVDQEAGEVVISNPESGTQTSLVPSSEGTVVAGSENGEEGLEGGMESASLGTTAQVPPAVTPPPIVPPGGENTTDDHGGPGNSTSRPAPEPDPEVVRLCNLLADLIHENGSKRPNPMQKQWLTACRLLMTKDGPDGKGWNPKQIEVILKWSQNDEFWRTNILSMPTLRKQFDKLRMRRNQDLGAGKVTKVNSKTSAMDAKMAELREQYSAAG